MEGAFWVGKEGSRWAQKEYRPVVGGGVTESGADLSQQRFPPDHCIQKPGKTKFKPVLVEDLVSGFQGG